MYVHMVFSRSPATCLDGVKSTWPRDGVLRVEILRSRDQLRPHKLDKDESALKDVIQTEENVDSELFNNSTLFDPQAVFKEPQRKTMEKSIGVASVTQLEDPYESADYSLNRTATGHLYDKRGSTGNSVDEHDDLMEAKLPPDERAQQSFISSLVDDVVSVYSSTAGYEDDLNEYAIEYSLEYGFLRLTAATRQKLGIPVMVIHLGKFSSFLILI